MFFFTASGLVVISVWGESTQAHSPFCSIQCESESSVSSLLVFFVYALVYTVQCMFGKNQICPSRVSSPPDHHHLWVLEYIWVIRALKSPYQPYLVLFVNGLLKIEFFQTTPPTHPTNKQFRNLLNELFLFSKFVLQSLANLVVNS